MKKRKAIVLAVALSLCACLFTACGEEEIPHEHVWKAWEELVPATCTKGGIDIRYCAGDDTHFEQRDTESKGHTIVEWFVENGGHIGFCEECFMDTEWEAHSFVNGACEVCGELKED